MFVRKSAHWNDASIVIRQNSDRIGSSEYQFIAELVLLSEESTIVNPFLVFGTPCGTPSVILLVKECAWLSELEEVLKAVRDFLDSRPGEAL